jgi:hypothetical protein
VITGDTKFGRCPQCGDPGIPLRDNGEIETHYPGGGAFQCAGTGQLPDTRTDLRRAEDWARAHPWAPLRELMARYDKLAAENPRLRAALRRRIQDAERSWAGHPANPEDVESWIDDIAAGSGDGLEQPGR